MNSISVIIPCFNAHSTIEYAIQSFIQQTYPQKELIIIDGGSNDGSIELINQYKTSISFFKSEKDRGVYDAINKGINVANGEWIFILGADDEFHSKDVLESISKYFSSNVDILSGRVINLDKAHALVPSLFVPKIGFSAFFRNTLHQQGTFYRKSVLPHPPFSPEYKVLSDYRTHLLLMKQKVRFTLIDQNISKCRAAGLSKRFDKSLYREEWEIKKGTIPLFWLMLNFFTIPIKYLLKKLF